ncbi:MAG: hypothetical protein KGI60_01995 [Patescibacteria group bacterium]|nr:hypothetical protein [Patescibacteria group bacterium]
MAKKWSIGRDFFLPSQELAEAIAKHHNSGCNCRIDALSDYMPTAGSPLDMERVRMRIGETLYSLLGERAMYYAGRCKEPQWVKVRVEARIINSLGFIEAVANRLVAMLHLRVHRPLAAEETNRLLKLLADEFERWLDQSGNERPKGRERRLPDGAILRSSGRYWGDVYLILNNACIRKLHASLNLPPLE